MDTCISNKIHVHVFLYLPACQKICNTAENCSLCQTKPHNHLLYQPTKCQEAIYRLIALYNKVKTLVSREWIQETLYKTDKVACKYMQLWIHWLYFMSQIGNTWSRLYHCFFRCTMPLKYLTSPDWKVLSWIRALVINLSIMLIIKFNNQYK